ncbi:lysophospholipid acyltransferase family protein [Derxia lacustris]|uniref:lysophospholipid acyltransferase family protein n=1 Tax=Derxia lacustris TaxID=764842 RepID=UPI000A177916|nr:lysophospholipid acyltransferase family protein [Derxia lacustris]
MAALRSALYLLVLTVTVIPYAIACAFFFITPLSWRYRFTLGWPRFAVWAAKVICGIRWQVIGEHNIPDEPVVYLSKHQSAWETLFLVWWLPREVCFVLKRSLLHVPFFGWGLGMLRMINIDRSKGADAFMQVVRQGKTRLGEGRSVVLFPEGTRTPVGSQGQYKTGGARLARATGARIVPIALNSGERWARNAFIKTPGLVTVSFGPPIVAVGRPPNMVNEEVEAWIEAEMRRLSPQVYPTSTPASAPPAQPATAA